MGAGSGAVFFSNCPLRCVYCQNAEIAQGAHGSEVEPSRLEQIFTELRSKGAANINLVTPTHYLPFVLRSIRRVQTAGFELPFICNTSGYETVDTVRSMHGAIDVYLTDFKYWRDGESDSARRYSNAPDYFEVAWRALQAMVQTAGLPRFDDTGRLLGGVMVRHLVLPGQLSESKRILQALWTEYGNDVLYSVMNQYTPLRAFPMAPELESRVPDDEYERLLDYLDMLGMTDYYWQQGDAAQESFIPAFDSTGVVRKG